MSARAEVADGGRSVSKVEAVRVRGRSPVGEGRGESSGDGEVIILVVRTER